MRHAVKVVCSLASEKVHEGRPERDIPVLSGLWFENTEMVGVEM